MSLRPCGKRFRTEEAARHSKRGLQPDAVVKGCRYGCGGWHVEFPAAPRTPIRPRSEKTKRTYEVRGPLVAALLAERPWCEIRWDAKCWGLATEVHEPGMRSRGADICDPEQCVTGCHYCHRMVHDHPAEATERGWMIPSGAGCAA